jgi:hypothetical protein
LNIESSSGGQVSKGGFASGFAFGYAPTGRSVFYKIDRSTQKLTTGGIHYSTFDVGRSMFISFFFDLTGRSADIGWADT